jgi:cation diffusion facilitator family transporter
MSREHEKKSAAFKSVVAAVFLTGLKLVVGWVSGSLGIMAEAAHSALDLAAAVVTYFAVKMSSKPADKQHLYGHGKIENLSALFESLLLLGTCLWIIHEAVGRLMGGRIDVDVSIWTFAVMGVSIVIDFTRSRMLHRMAVKHKSQALEADALHFSTDIWSSAVVIIGLCGVWLAEQSPRFDFLKEADSIAALFVAAIVIWVSGKLGYRTILELLDTAPKDVATRVKEIALSVENVRGCHAVRVRNSGPEVFIDAHLELEGSLSLTEAHRLTELVEEAIRKEIVGADVTVHAEPLGDSAGDTKNPSV